MSCKNLTSVTIPNGVTYIGASAFYGCENLKSVTIPNSVTSIGNSAFRGCKNLTSVIIPNGVTSIGSYTFYDCRNLTSVIIPNGVTSIGNEAFSFCDNLKSVTIPNSVTYIGAGAFFDCDNLTIYCEAESEQSNWKENWNTSDCPVVWGTPRLDVFEAAHAMTADFATKDGNGNVISDTYATNAEITDIKNGTITVGKATEAVTAGSANALSTSMQNLSASGGETTKALTVGKLYAMTINISGVGRETAVMLVHSSTSTSISSVTQSGYVFKYSPSGNKITIHQNGNQASGALQASIREI